MINKKRRDFIILLLSEVFMFSTVAKAEDIVYFRNNDLTTVKNDFLGNEMLNGEFINLKSEDKSIFEILKWKFSSNPKREKKTNENYRLKVIKNPEVLNSKDDYICWLGHASFLIQIDGKKLVTDPCLTSPPFVTRHTDLPFEIRDINPNYLLVSHGHYDHLDSDTVRHFNNSIALIPLKMSSIINSMNQTIKTQEAGWFQKYDIDEKFKIYFLPSYHWHKRNLIDANKVLWGSYIIETQNKTIYFAGDTGYNSHFKEIGELFDIDIAILPIGAYAPRWFMKDSHMNPKDAIQAFSDLKAKELIPMHFGTFDISDEPMGEPEDMIREFGINKNLRLINIGEKILFNKKEKKYA